MPLEITDRTGRTATLALTGEGAGISLRVGDGGFLSVTPNTPSPFVRRRAASMVSVSALAMAAVVMARRAAPQMSVAAQGRAALVVARRGAVAVGIGTGARVQALVARHLAAEVTLIASAGAVAIRQRSAAAEVAIAAAVEAVGLLITATITPAIGTIAPGDTIASGLSADYDQISNFDTTVGTIDSVVAAITVDGSPALASDTVSAGETVELAVTVTASTGQVRVFTANRIVGVTWDSTTITWDSTDITWDMV